MSHRYTNFTKDNLTSEKSSSEQIKTTDVKIRRFQSQFPI